MGEHAEQIEPTRAGIRKGSSSFLSNVLTLGSASAIGQLIAIGTAPLVTRLFAPDAFGLAAVVGTLFVIVGPVATGKYDVAVSLPREDEKAASLLGLALLINALTTVAVAVALLGFGTSLLHWLELEGLGRHALWILPLGIGLTGCTAALRAWHLRARRFRTLATSDVGQSAGTAGASIAAGVLGLVSGLDLTVSRLLVQALIPFWLGGNLLRERRFLRAHWQVASLRAIARRYADFPRYMVPTTLLNATSRGLPTLVLASTFGPAVAGLFALANRIVVMPSQLIGGSTAQVLFQKVAEQQAHERPSGPLLELVVSRLARIALLPATLLIAAGPPLFARCFGPEWEPAGEYARVLAPWIVTLIVTSPLGALWSVFERQRFALVYNVVLLALRLGGLALGAAWFDTPVAALALFMAASVLCHLFTIGYLGRLAGVRFAPLVGDFLLWTAIALACAAIPWGAQRFFAAGPWLFVGVALQILAFGLLVIALDGTLRDTLRTRIVRLGTLRSKP